MREVVFRRTGWIPNVVRQDGELRIELGAGADAAHQPRTFTFPVSEAHLEVIRDDLPRHLLLWCAVLPLCDAAGTRGPLDEPAAVALLDPILLGSPPDVEAFLSTIPWRQDLLVGHGADIELLERGEIFAALREATAESDGPRVAKYVADRNRARRGVHLSPLDAAVLNYTGQYIHGSTIPRRKPDAVDPALLPEVLRVIAVAEQACAGMRIGLDPRRGRRSTEKRAWDRMSTAVDDAVRRAYPELADDAVRTVSFLMCSEAADRSRNAPWEDDEELVGDRPDLDERARKTALNFTDDKDGEVTWTQDGPRTAGTEFWEFVADRVGSGNQVFTIEDESMGEGIQLHFYADSAARITTVAQGVGGSGPTYRVEYCLVDGLDGYRALVSTFVRGGCAALEPHGPWTSDVGEFEAARRRRDAELGS
ncbi:DUF6357 family protein [Cellulosimicrobium sp. PMB13]|uniref:DUF6357 family protein n=1 Tax=Cellulosimicrobium sp. PMB13 TaxID=3120158 RepID=UPI003F4B0AF2